jgi:methylaspartate ammonia-lyase
MAALHMPKFTIRTVNSGFVTNSEIDKHRSEDALRYGVSGALMIAADDVKAGMQAGAVEVMVENELGKLIHRAAVMVAVAPLAIDANLHKALPVHSNDL